jgi:hypothetical protein
MPNALTFSPAEGGPSNDWIDINVSWDSSKALDANYRQLLIQICNIMGDRVICEKKYDGAGYYTHKWRILAKNLNTDLSREISNGGASPQGANASENSLGGGLTVLSSFVGYDVDIYGNAFPINKLKIYKEERIVYIYLRTNIDYKLETEKLPTYIKNNITYHYSPFGTEGHKGQHIYKLIVPENTGEDRVMDIELSSMDIRFRGSTISHITQYGSYKDDKDPTHNEYSLIKEASVWPFSNQYDSLTLHTIARKPYVLSDINHYVRSMNFFSQYTFDSPCPASEGHEFTEIPLINVEKIGTLKVNNTLYYSKELRILMNNSTITIKLKQSI